jgi:hypothetical protein
MLYKCLFLIEWRTDCLLHDLEVVTVLLLDIYTCLYKVTVSSMCMLLVAMDMCGNKNVVTDLNVMW